jgi:hypothetical protein
MSGQKVGMEVRKKHMPDLHAKLCGVREVLLDVSLRIHDNTRRTLLIRN